MNHYYFYIDDAYFGPLFIKVCSSYAPWGTKLSVNGHEWAKRKFEKKGGSTRRWTMGSYPAPSRRHCSRSATRWGRMTSSGYSRNGYIAFPCHCARRNRAAGYD